VPLTTNSMASVDPLLVKHCVCPDCRGTLAWGEERADCRDCGKSYPIVDGIPVFALLGDEDHHKREQAELSFDAREAAWEVERPAGASQLYAWLMEQKFRRSIAGIESIVPGALTLVTCAGSGMDSEFLARRGAAVIASDLSLDAARRVRERSRRHNVALVALVADVEALPFRDRGVALTYVHDGLHHLHDPEVGAREMARVAGRAISINEPARAVATRVAIKLHIAFEHEPVGNRVERIDPAGFATLLREAGLTVVGTDRYAMFYHHEPGPAMRLMSRALLAPAARGSVNAFNATLGRRLGNKVAIRAVRDASSPTSS
jgi:uncharacterized protein YbaR (Trm112 family)